MSEDFQIWRLIIRASLALILGITLSAASCNAYKSRLAADLVKQGIPALSVRCALFYDSQHIVCMAAERR